MRPSTVSSRERAYAMTLSRVEERDSGPYAEYTHLLMSGPSVEVRRFELLTPCMPFRRILSGESCGCLLTLPYMAF